MFRIDGIETCPASVASGSNIGFQSTPFQLSKPRWVSDDDVNCCAICKNRFNQIRRRHHCRCCGKVLCNKCCTEKVPLPQYGLDNPERVCSACLPTASCVTMSYSSDPAFQLKAVTGLSSLCRDNPAAVVALGGAHLLLFLAKKAAGRLQTVTHVANGLHTLSRHECLTVWLADVGALAAISNMLTLASENMSENSLSLLVDALGALRILVKTNESLKVLAFNAGCFPILLTLSNHTDSGVALTATITLCLLAESPQNHNDIINQSKALRLLLLKVIQTADEQVKEHVLRIMVVLSAGNNDVKHIISSEDTSCGGVFAQALNSKPKNLQILASASCVIANLATYERDQVLLQSSLYAVLEQLKYSHPEYVLMELIRAAANFSAHLAHANTVLLSIDHVVGFLSNNGSQVNNYAVRCIFNLLRHCSRDTIKALCRNGITDFLLRLTEMKAVMDQTVDALNKAAPPIKL